MICKHCGSQLSESMCPSCKKSVSLSYTSRELADLLGIGRSNNHILNQNQLQSAHVFETAIPSNATEDQLRSAYNSGFEAGHKHGFAEGYNSAQNEAALAARKRQRFFVILAACCTIVLALLSAIITGAIRYSIGYENGKDNGYYAGYEQGLLVTPTPSPTTIPTPTPTNTPVPTPTITPSLTPNPTTTPTSTQEPLLLLIDSEGEKVRQLQDWLISLDYLAENESDGVFGPKTERAVEQFQAAHKLAPTGIVDQALWDLIMNDSTVLTSSPMVTVTSPSTVDSVEESHSENGTNGDLQIDNQQTAEFPLPTEPYQQEISGTPVAPPAGSPVPALITTIDADGGSASESGNNEGPEQSTLPFDQMIRQAINTAFSLWQSQFGLNED